MATAKKQNEVVGTEQEKAIELSLQAKNIIPGVNLKATENYRFTDLDETNLGFARYFRSKTDVIPIKHLKLRQTLLDYIGSKYKLMIWDTPSDTTKVYNELLDNPDINLFELFHEHQTSIQMIIVIDNLQDESIETLKTIADTFVEHLDYINFCIFLNVKTVPMGSNSRNELDLLRQRIDEKNYLSLLRSGKNTVDFIEVPHFDEKVVEYLYDAKNPSNKYYTISDVLYRPTPDDIEFLTQSKKLPLQRVYEKLVKEMKQKIFYKRFDGAPKDQLHESALKIVLSNKGGVGKSFISRLMGDIVINLESLDIPSEYL